MRIAFIVRKLMMNPVRRHPENRPALERERRAPGQEIFHPFRSLVSAMRQKPVIAHPDSEAARYPPQENGGEKCRPGKEKKCRNCAHMKQAHGDLSAPSEAIAVPPFFTIRAFSGFGHS